MTIVPLPNYVLVEPDHQKEQVTSSGIVLADPKWHHVPNEGTVYAVGSAIKEDIKPGDRVRFIEDKPHGFKFEDRPMFRLEIHQIIGVYEPETPAP